MADGRARGVFDGNVRVNRGAQKTDAGQVSRNLLLGPRATVNVKPNLQIVADDVRCTHGAAISDLEEDQLFYLRSVPAAGWLFLVHGGVWGTVGAAVGGLPERSSPMARSKPSSPGRMQGAARRTLKPLAQRTTAKPLPNPATHRSRGINEAAAKSILVSSFGREVVQKLEDEALQARVEARVAEALLAARMLE